MILNWVHDAWRSDLRIFVPLKFSGLPLWEASRWTQIVTPLLARLTAEFGSRPSFEVTEVYNNNRFPAVKLGKIDWENPQLMHWCLPSVGRGDDEKIFHHALVTFPRVAVPRLPRFSFHLEVKHVNAEEPTNMHSCIVVVVKRRVLRRLAWLPDDSFWSAIEPEATSGCYVRRAAAMTEHDVAAMFREDVVYQGITDEPFPRPDRMPKRLTRFSIDSFRQFLRSEITR